MKRVFTTIAALILLTGAKAESPLDGVRAAFVRASIATYAPNDHVTDNFIAYSDKGRANDVLLLQLYMSVHLPDAEVERLLSGVDEEGRWSDIDYNDKTRGRWQPTLHVTRLYALAKLYADPDSKWYGEQRLHLTLHNGLKYWFRTMPVCPNWWHNDIGVPKKLTAVLLMIRDELSEEEIAGGLKVLERSAFGRTGQNKVWLAGNNLMKGLLTDDPALVEHARDVMAEEIYCTTDEGIQPDWSFHQHGPQIQFGNYGLAYAEGLSFWMRVLDSTPYAFTDNLYSIVEHLLTEGICWSVWKGVMDPSFCGRQVFIDGGRGKAYSLAVAAQNMAATGSPSSKTFTNISRQNLQPERYANALCGAKYYPRSDCGIFRTPKWYASIRMHSRRTIGFEMTNRENLLANFSADGALLSMQHGNEYDNIFAHWDWRRVPGVTAYDDGKPIKCSDNRADKCNHSEWVGGVSGDGVLCTTMELCRDSLNALKSNFFFDDAVIALGCDIRSDDPRCRQITTAIDQTHLCDRVTVGMADGRTVQIEQGSPIERHYNAGEVAWLNHDNRGYLILDGSSLVLSTVMQHGVWDMIDPFYQNREQQGRVFKCYVDHDTARADNTYAYALLPCRTAKQTARLALHNDIRVVCNDAECQAVAYNETLCAIFHKKGQVTVDRTTIAVDAPLLVIVQGRDVFVSSPLRNVDRANVTVTRNGRQSRLTFDLPVDDAHLGTTQSQKCR